MFELKSLPEIETKPNPKPTHIKPNLEVESDRKRGFHLDMSSNTVHLIQHKPVTEQKRTVCKTNSLLKKNTAMKDKTILMNSLNTKTIYELGHFMPLLGLCLLFTANSKMQSFHIVLLVMCIAIWLYRAVHSTLW